MVDLEIQSNLVVSWAKTNVKQNCVGVCDVFASRLLLRRTANTSLQKFFCRPFNHDSM